jgi:ADP-ribosylglycohydrolase
MKEMICMTENTNIWLNGIMGVVVGDALGCPVQFESREEVARHPVTSMRGYGTFNLPEGSWTDDSSLTIALLESIRRVGKIDLDDIMGNFMKWLYDGEFTPYGESYDIGRGTMQAINRYKKNRKAKKCGGDEEWNNGNGSLMRIMPACLYCSVMESSGMYSDRDAIDVIHSVGGLTHAHIRSNIACGLYFFMAKYILFREGSLQERMQEGLTQGFAFYESYLADKENLHYYDRLKDLETFKSLTAEKIKSTGYVVDALEAAVWSLLTTGSFNQALLKAVNLGDDTDTVGAIVGGLAGLYYGYDSIPEEWLSAIKHREWIEDMCRIKE